MFGAIILMISNIVVKLIGAFLSIPLTEILKVEGMAYYNTAYSIYVNFYTISTAGIPVAVSRMIATANSKNNYKEIKKTFKVAFLVFFVIGFVGTLTMILIAKPYANFIEMPDAYIPMLAIAPTVFFICLSSAYRGYFQGLQNMVPTAVSQVIESLTKLALGLFFAIYLTKLGLPTHIIAAFVILGVTVGVLLGFVYGAISKAMFCSSAEYKNGLLNCTEDSRKYSKILSELIVIAIPITLASSIMGLTNTVDVTLFVKCLRSTGIDKIAATEYYGTYTSMVYKLFNLVPPFIYTFGISAIPAISSAITVGNKEKAFKDIESAFRNCSVIAIPCAIGLSTLSKRIISLLFREQEIINGDTVISSHDIAAPALSMLSIGILFLGIISITNSVLQACKSERYTIISTVSGIVVKIISILIFARIPGLGLLGAAISTLLCYFTIMCLNLIFMIKKTGFVPKVHRILTKPLISGICCGVGALATSYLLGNVDINQKIVTLIAIMVAVVIYFGVLVLIKGLNRYDVMMMPKGAKLCSLLDKFNLLEKDEK